MARDSHILTINSGSSSIKFSLYGLGKTESLILKGGLAGIGIEHTKIIKLYVDDEPFVLGDANLNSFQRILDLRAGTLDREILWELPSGKHVSIKSRRLVSYEHRHLATISYEVTLLNADAQIVIASEMRNKREARLRKGDPRLHQTLKGKVLLPLLNSSQAQRVILGHKTEHSHLKLVCGIDHLIETAGHYSVSRESSEDEGQVVFSCQGQSGRAIMVTKFMAYHTSQADVALAMFLLGDKFSLDQKRRNFDYYDPLTTGDSSLSVCIESIMALETGHLDKALEYAHYAMLMDLEDIDGNVKDGCHMASMGGSWMLCVYGLAGLRDYGGCLKFHPRLPKGLKRLCFPLSLQGQVLEINVEPELSTYLLREGSQFTIWHQDQQVTLSRGGATLISKQSLKT